MTDIIVSVAEFKANLSRILSESRSSGKSIIITKRKKPIATVLPYTENDRTVRTGPAGLASLAGTWKELEEISPFIEEAVESRGKDIYREISL